MKRKIILIISIITVLLVVINMLQKKVHWVNYKININTSDEIFYKYKTMIFIDDKTGFLGGEFYNIKEHYNDWEKAKMSAFIVKTENSGKSWKQVYHGDGSLETLKHVENGKIFGVISKRISYSVHHSSIIVSNDKGTTWEKLFDFKFLILDIFFCNNNDGVLIKMNNDGNESLFITDDGGNNWKEIVLHNKMKVNNYSNVFAGINKRGDFVYLAQNGKIINYNIFFRKENTIKTLDNFKIQDISFNEKGKLFVAGEENSEIGILYFDESLNEKKIKLPFSGDKMKVERIYIYEKSIKIIVISNMDFFGVNYSFYFSNDFGDTWHEEKMLNSINVFPVAFYQNKYIWAKGSGYRDEVQLGIMQTR